MSENIIPRLFAVLESKGCTITGISYSYSRENMRTLWEYQATSISVGVAMMKASGGIFLFDDMEVEGVDPITGQRVRATCSQASFYTEGLGINATVDFTLKEIS